MNKKILILILVVILILGGVAFYIFGGKQAIQGVQQAVDGTPFGSVGGNRTNTGQTQTDRAGGGLQVSIPNQSGAVLKKLVEVPVAGFTFMGSGASTSIRYAEGGTGRIADIKVATSEVTIPPTFADTQSRVVVAYFFNQGRSIVRFKENDDGTLSGLYSNLASSTPIKKLTSSILFFDTNITEDKAIFVVQNGLGSNSYISSPDGTEQKLLWQGALQSIALQALNKDAITIQTKPSIASNGAVFNLVGSIPQFMFSGGSGFKANLSADGTLAIFSDYTNVGSPIQIFNKTKNLKRNLFIKTVPEKCIWSKTKTDIFFCFSFKGKVDALPDDWYLGGRFLNADSLWKFSEKNDVSVVAFDFSSAEEKIDPINLRLSKDEQVIGFLNKKDGSLWAIDLARTDFGF
mgnify:FL=1